MEKEFVVNVKKKTVNNLYFAQGSSLGYTINGEESKVLYLKFNGRYKFNIKTKGHPFYFTTSVTGGGLDLIGNVMKDNNKIIENGVLEIIPKRDFKLPIPKTFYYQCTIHPKMGGIVNLIDDNGSKDTDDNVSSSSSKVNNNSKISKIKLNKVVENLEAITCIKFDKHNIMYICEQKGIVYRVDLNSKVSNKFIDVTRYVNLLNLRDSYDERGLLGFALHPNYFDPSSKEGYGRCYIYYSVAISRYNETSRSGIDHYGCLSRLINKFPNDFNTEIDIRTETVLLRIKEPFSNHNGGNILFGEDGYLYIGVGDGGGANDPLNTSQDYTSVHGKILRIDVNSPDTSLFLPYSIPEDNPPAKESPFNKNRIIRREVWALGLRNPWGMSFDSKGRLFVADVGQDNFEEVNIVNKGGNYGWPIKEGLRNNKPHTANKNAISSLNFQSPIYSYGREDGISVIGGYIDENSGEYIFGDFSGVIYSIRKEDTTSWERNIKLEIPNKFIRCFGKDYSSGNVYVATSTIRGLSKDRKATEIYKIDLFRE